MPLRGAPAICQCTGPKRTHAGRITAAAVLVILAGACTLAVTPRMDVRTVSFPPPDFSPPQPERHTLDNGMRVFLLEDHEIPLVQGRAIVRTGSVFDPPGKTGMADIMGSLLVRGGTRDYPGSRLAEVLEDGAIEMGSGISRQSGSVSFNALSSEMYEALGLFADVLRRPAFESGSLELEKKKAAEGIKRVIDDPDSLTFREFRRLFYGDDPRGRSATVDEVSGVTREDVDGFYRKHFHPDRIMLGFSGDFNKEDLLARIDELFGDWPPSGEDALDWPIPERGGMDTAISLINRDLPQSTIALGTFAPPKDSDYYPPFILADYILGGGGFNSRLTREIRSNRGLAYSAGSFYRGDIGYGVFVAYAKTKNESAPEVLGLMSGILEDMKTAGVTEEELSWARDSIINGMIFGYSSSAAILGEAMSLEYDGLPADFVSRLKTRIQETTAAEVFDASAAFFNPQSSTVVILGKASDHSGAWPPGRTINHLAVSPDGRIH